MYPIIFFTIAVTAATTYIFVGKKEKTIANIMRVYLNFLVFFCIGIQGILAAFMHTFFANFAAAQIGWVTGSPFQFEVAMASLGFSVVGFLAFRGSLGMRAAAVIAPAVFLLGAAGGHVWQMVHAGNFAPGNAGSVFWTDLLVPVIGFTLLRLAARAADDTSIR